MSNPTIKSYHQDQLIAFSPSLVEVVPKNHTVRVVNDIINQVNLDVLINEYECKGRANYNYKEQLQIVQEHLPLLPLLHKHLHLKPL